MKTVVFQADAEAEMIEAAAYYEAQQSDLGRRFLASVQDSINRIVINSQLYPIVELDVRRCLTRTFPSLPLASTCANVLDIDRIQIQGTCTP